MPPAISHLALGMFLATCAARRSLSCEAIGIFAVGARRRIDARIKACGGWLLLGLFGCGSDLSSAPPLIGMAAPLTRVCCHNLSATATGTMASLFHHSASSAWR